MDMDPAQSQPALPASLVAAVRRAAAERQATRRLTDAEQTVVRLAASAWRGDSAAAALQHASGVSRGLEASRLDQIRWGGYSGQPRLDALVAAARLVLRQNGRLDGGDRAALDTLDVDAATRAEIARLIGVVIS